MNTQATETIETEWVLEPVWSLNRSRLLARLMSVLMADDASYDIMPSLEFDVNGHRFTPDLALLPRQPYDWEADVLRCPIPPVIAIAILSPTQAFDAVANSIRDQWLPSGAQSAWLVLPLVQHIFLFLPGQPPQLFTGGTLHDPATQIETNLDTLFR